MRTFTIFSSALALTASLAAASPSSAMQLPDIAQGVIDWAASSNDGAHASSSWQFVDCGEPDDVIEIKSLRVVPDPPVPGEKMTVYADGLAKQRIEVSIRERQMSFVVHLYSERAS